jgi:hypothetical protein
VVVSDDDDDDDDDEVYEETYGEMIDRLVDKKWETAMSDVCCVECGRLIEGDPEERWTGETSDGTPIVDLVCKECVA